ncbi:MAG: ComEC/Rec2 family competence protein, partial [Microthrixaceae bacterium]
ARFRFRATGLGHLLAVSGQNVAFVLVLARPLLSRCGLRTRVVAGLAVLALFVLVTRAEPSVLRATAMAAVALVASGTGRVAPGGRVLALAITGLLLVDPLLVRSVGFRLSVAASIGLLVLSRPLERRLRGPAWFREPLATTLAASAGTLPVTLGLSGGVPVVSVVANVLAVPAAGVVMVVGLGAGLVAGAVREAPAALLHRPTAWLLAWIDGVARVGARVPTGQLGPVRLAWLAVVGLLAWWWARHRPAAVSGTRTSARLLGVLLLCSPALLPPRLGPGSTAVAPGARVRAGPCGAEVVVGRAARTGKVLEGLWRAGVTSAVEVRSVGADRVVLGDLQRQLVRAPEAAEGACSVRGRAPPPRRP